MDGGCVQPLTYKHKYEVVLHLLMSSILHLPTYTTTSSRLNTQDSTRKTQNARRNTQNAKRKT